MTKMAKSFGSAWLAEERVEKLDIEVSMNSAWQSSAFRDQKTDTSIYLASTTSLINKKIE